MKSLTFSCTNVWIVISSTQPVSCSLPRQRAVDQQVGDLEVGRVLAELLDRIAAVLEDAGVAVDVGDRAAAGGRVHVRRVVGHQPEVLVVGLDLAQVHRAHRAVLDGQLVGRARAVVGDRHVSLAALMRSVPAIAALGCLDLALVVTAEVLVAVRPQRRRVERHERQLRDRQARVELDRHAREVVELERQRALPAGVAEAGGGVHDQPEPAELDLALDPRDDVVGQLDVLERAAEAELAGVDHERLALGRRRPARSGRAADRAGRSR